MSITPPEPTPDVVYLDPYDNGVIDFTIPTDWEHWTKLLDLDHLSLDDWEPVEQNMEAEPEMTLAERLAIILDAYHYPDTTGLDPTDLADYIVGQLDLLAEVHHAQNR